MFLLILFCIVLVLAIVQSFVNNSIPKRESYLSLLFNTATMAALFYWDKDNILILLAMALLILFLSSCLFYFLVYKPVGKEGLLKMAEIKENKIKTIINTVIIVVLPISIKSEIIMALAFAAYLTYDRIVFYRKFSSMF